MLQFTPLDLALAVGFLLSVGLPLAVVAVVVRGYREGTHSTAAIRLAVGVVLVAAAPTLLRLGFGAVVPGGAWVPLLVRSTQLVGLLVVLGVMHGD
ncbi:hypothetical protein SY89_00821 [Halolamina pelagica]|uniref:Uncharacterized protein n=1 Tax=Halolamina pelagica TaxID=699431 RepID=A0A0N8HZP7_9EURY|nr:hypothetical protein [Halolamina pelagica]KPN30099.1 hypothetical protein SY89_00821 [Halolamina pelagica]